MGFINRFGNRTSQRPAADMVCVQCTKAIVLPVTVTKDTQGVPVRTDPDACIYVPSYLCVHMILYSV